MLAAIARPVLPLALGLLIALTGGLAGCSAAPVDEDGPPLRPDRDAGTDRTGDAPPDEDPGIDRTPTPCPPGELEQADGGCLPAGVPPSLCAETFTATDGGGCEPILPPETCTGATYAVPGMTECAPVGVPPEACGPALASDGNGGCVAVLPETDCPAGLMAVPGETECREVAPCGEGTYGDIPVDATTQHVDQGYAGTDSDGTADRPWTTVQAGVDAAADGAIVAVAAGTYLENVEVTRPVRLLGRCPSLTVISGPDPTKSGIGLTAGASGSQVRGFTVIDGLSVIDATDVVLADLYLRDTTNYALGIGSGSATLTNALVENIVGAGVLVVGGTLTASRLVVRDTTQPDPSASAGGLVIGSSGTVGSTVSLSESLIERTEVVAVYSQASNVDIRQTVIRRPVVQPAVNTAAFGLFAEADVENGAPSNVHVESTVIEDTVGQSVRLLASKLELVSSTVRNTALAKDQQTTGILASSKAGATTSQVDVRSSLFEANSIGVNYYSAVGTVEDTVLRGQTNWGILIDRDETTDDPRSKVTLRRSLIVDTTGGLDAEGADLTIEDLAVRHTVPFEDGDGGGLLFEAGGGEASVVTLTRALLEDIITVAVLLDAAKATLDQVVTRRVAMDSRGEHGVGVAVLTNTPELRPELTLRRSLVESSHTAGVLVAGSRALIEGVVVRDTGVNQTGVFGMGLQAYNDFQTGDPFEATVRHSLFDNNSVIGCNFSNGTATVEGVRIKDTRPGTDGLGGRGLEMSRVRYPDPDDPEGQMLDGPPATGTVRGSLVEDVAEAGISAWGDVDLDITGTLIRGITPGGTPIGDGVLAYGGARVDLTSSRVEQSARAGVSSFGASVIVTASDLACNAIQLDQETYLEQAAYIEDGGQNLCSCDDRLETCRALSSQLTPPTPPDTVGPTF